jgi:hypothetical protein
VEEPPECAGAVADPDGVPRRVGEPGVVDTSAGDATATGAPGAADDDVTATGAADDDVAGPAVPLRLSGLLLPDGVAVQAVAPRAIAASATPPAMTANRRPRPPPVPSLASGVPGTVRVLMGLLDRTIGQAEAKNIDASGHISATFPSQSRPRERARARQR